MIPAGPYGYRINQPGYGPKIISSVLSDLGPFPSGVGPFTDLRYNTTNFVGSGPPANSTLLAGNYDAALPGTGYIIGDWYFDYTNKNLYGCTTAGSNASSAWSQISGSGSAINAYTITVVNQNTVGATIVLPNGSAGNVTTVNKPLELQGSLASEVIDGNTVSYSSYADSYNMRVATYETSTETQYITPRYTVGQVIIGIQVVYLGLTEINPSRQWGGVN